MITQIEYEEIIKDLNEQIEWLQAEVKRFEKEHPCCAYAEGEERG